MEEVKSILRRLDPDAASDPERARDPMYESSQPDGTIDEQWCIRMPPCRLRGFATETTDFVRILRMLSVYPHEEKVRQALVSLSLEFNRLRTLLKEQSRRCDLDVCYTYLVVLKKVGRFFENSDSAFDSYFPHCQNAASAHFLYEYMQVLILTTARLYETATARDVPDAGTVNDLLHCQYLFDELRRCAEYCLSDKLLQSGKWLYQQSPESLGSGNTDQQSTAASTLASERKVLRRFIRDDLQGMEAISARCTLLRIKMNEAAVTPVAERIASLPNPSEQCRRVYSHLAPLMLCITQQYDQITVQLRGGAKSPLLYYTQYQSYYWYVRREMALARAEWTCFGMESFLEFDTYGKRAVRRLCVLRKEVTGREKWIASLRPSASLQRKWETLKKTVLQLHDDVRAGVVDSLWLSASGVSVPELVAYKAEPDQRNLLTVFAEKWDAMVAQNPMWSTVFDFFEELVVATSAASTDTALLLVDSPPPPTSRRCEMENQRVLGVVEERREHLDWLISMIDAEGVINISREGCLYLREESARLDRFIARNKIDVTK